MLARNACEIFSVSHKNSIAWKWRYTGVDGCMQACAEEYRLFLECTAAARASGYEPRSDWTGPCALINTQKKRPGEDTQNETLA